MAHKAGFVNILGKPNAGKSTLMNVLLGEKLSITTYKAQTTRHRILGILNEDDYQIVFSDTPGIMEPKYKLHQKMMHYVEEAVEDADVFLLVVDGTEDPKKPEQEEFYGKILNKVRASNAPIIVALNKIDLLTEEQLNERVEALLSAFPGSEVVPISSTEKFNTDSILRLLLKYIPENPPYYEKDAVSDRPLRFFASEIIREKILLNYEEEIPYSVQVAVTSYKEEENIDRISADIYVARESQKGIIIGKGGSALKKTGTQARKDLEKFLGKKVFLELFVKVKKDWRDDETQLNRFGY